MKARPDTCNYRQLFLDNTPFLDLRAPAEFAHGAFPTSCNLPLMSDDERAQVGTCYKQRGQAAAIELGHRLVAGLERERRLAAWSDFARRNPEGYLYCWRGGLRSQTVQQWLAEAGVHYPRVEGGYKALRRFLIDELARSLARAQLVLVSGRTGTGKTRVIAALQRAVDLEGLARHRGSSFGHLPEGQPSQTDFENALSVALLRLLNQGDGPVYLEDEGRLIGRLALPENLREKMQAAPMLVVEESVEQRIEVVLQDYIVDLGQRYIARDGVATGAECHSRSLLDGLDRIRKRLGGARHQAIRALMEDAFRQQRATGDIEAHRLWIRTLLETYYDPMYSYQLSQRAGRILFQGDRGSVLSHIEARSPC
ncbi:tRNA 2-selenouridine(34) synthase MnmH [Kineobactrum sediminis]|uniref:tRNA 2-selenouridine synthase n=1 Tax=Kineobactrum sediminis TaxID=1905677 RepID=A0A2N5Y7G6_9GAMM|nr:tRNA 2-selenouridine(34) synthase MnmH [Kineobactrum sediminis]PLW84330.1 tRNA 2-selenouridine(34) synthase MnmH [Kineobactrum sediminis]